jgi:hypothetical protein
MILSMVIGNYFRLYPRGSWRLSRLRLPLAMAQALLEVWCAMTARKSRTLICRPVDQIVKRF